MRDEDLQSYAHQAQDLRAREAHGAADAIEALVAEVRRLQTEAVRPRPAQSATSLQYARVLVREWTAQQQPSHWLRNFPKAPEEQRSQCRKCGASVQIQAEAGRFVLSGAALTTPCTMTHREWLAAHPRR